jgi:PAS domain S-box-containing protein
VSPSSETINGYRPRKYLPIMGSDMADIDAGVAAGENLVVSGKVLLEEPNSPDWFRVAFHNSSLGMAITDGEGMILACNDTLSRMLGYEKSDLEGSFFSDVTHADDKDLSADQVRQLLAGEIQTARLDKRYLTRDGRVVWGRVSVATVADSSDLTLHFLIQIEDVTAQRRAEAAAAVSEESFRLTFESAASGMALVDPTNGRFLKVNAAGCRMLGYAEDELKALSIQDVTAPGDREESFGRYRKVIEGEVSFSQAKLHYLRSDGSTAYGIISTALVRDAQGEPLHLVANVVDITEQVRAQDKLEETVASKDQLIASVSHELRTPLTGILGFSEILRDETSSMSTDERVELVQTIANQTTDLTNIVEDLLVAARTDNETLTVVRVPVDLRAQAAQVVETLARTGHPDVLVTGGTARAQGDPARVRQILRNLISNAFRYGGENIEVVAYECDSSSCVAVTDDGPGVPDDDQERIFEPYQRVSHREGLTASIGLGLTVSKKLANLMEGELTYRYENERSIFELILPSIQEDQ